jgi:hypothetical protein
MLYIEVSVCIVTRFLYFLIVCLMLDALLSMAAIAILQPCYFAILDVTSPRLDNPNLIVVSR